MGFRFPEGFRWGTASSAYQFEGNNTASDWWLWEQEPGRIAHGHRSGLACDWWRNAERDFELMAGLHQNAARLSLEWSRLEPREGVWDASAEARYLEMLRGLRARSMEPLVTLNHFTLPQWVAERGGWLWEGIVPAFGRYADRAARAVGSLVDFWITLNEPVGHLFAAYVIGRFAPGRASPAAFVAALLRSIRAHEVAYRALHEVQPNARVSIAAYLRPFQPANPDSVLDKLLAVRLDHLINWMYLDALVTGHFVGPFGVRARVRREGPTLDFLGVNYYTRSRVAFDIRRPRQLFTRPEIEPGAVVSDATDSEIFPDGLLAVLHRARQYDLPIYITENGLPDVDDDLRPAFIVEHLRRVAQALEEGCPVRGYYHWSIVDNFEWADGWTLRFGLHALDTTTQVRTARPSAALYGEICRQNALP